jgi:hypothetical protein
MKTDLPTYDEVLEMLTAKAREGSVSAMVVLERALRPPGDDPEGIEEDELDRLLAGDGEDQSLAGGFA